MWGNWNKTRGTRSKARQWAALNLNLMMFKGFLWKERTTEEKKAPVVSINILDFIFVINILSL